jgi:hypothetical protein
MVGINPEEGTIAERVRTYRRLCEIRRSVSKCKW